MHVVRDEDEPARSSPGVNHEDAFSARLIPGEECGRVRYTADGAWGDYCKQPYGHLWGAKGLPTPCGLAPRGDAPAAPSKSEPMEVSAT